MQGWFWGTATIERASDPRQEHDRLNQEFFRWTGGSEEDDNWGFEEAETKWPHHYSLKGCQKQKRKVKGTVDEYIP